MNVGVIKSADNNQIGRSSDFVAVDKKVAKGCVKIMFQEVCW